LLRLEPGNGYAYLEKGRALIALGREADAIVPLTQATVIVPQEPHPHALLADLYYDKKDFAKASGYFAQALQKGWGDNLDLALKAADAFVKASDKKAAHDILLQAEQYHSDNRRFNAAIGLLEAQLKDSASARVHLEKVLQGTVDDPRIFITLAAIYTSGKEYLKAIRMFEQTIPVVQDKNACRIELGKLFLLKGEPANARVYLEKIVSLDSNYPGVYRYMGDAFRASGDEKKALGYYIRERGLSGDSPYLQREIARLSFTHASQENAKKEQQRLIRVVPSDPDPYYRLSSIFLKEKNVKKAQYYLAEGAKRGEADEEMYYQLANGYALLGQYSRAEETYKKCIEKNPSREAAWVGLGDVQLKAGKDSVAAETFMHIATFGSDEYRSYPRRAGKIFERLGLKEKARYAYNFFLGRKNTDAEVNARLARLEYSAGNHEAVVMLLDNPGMRDALTPDIQMILGKSYLAQEKYSEALPIFDALVDRKPDFGEAIRLSGEVAEKTGDLRKAIVRYRRLVSLKSGDGIDDLALRIGILLEELGDKEEAKKQYRTNIENFPARIENYENLARLCMDERDWACAQGVLEKGVVLSGAPDTLRRMLALTYENQDMKERAIEQYARYLGGAASDSTALLSMGQLHYSRKEYRKAIDPLRRAAGLMPGNFDAAYMLGESYYNIGKFTEAIEMFNKARALKSTDVRVVKALARCYREQNDTKTLITILREWLFLDEENVDIQIELGRALLADHNTAEAVRLLETASRRRPDDLELHRILSKTYEATGNEVGRLEHLLAAEKISPRNGPLLNELGSFYLRKGRKNDAEKYFAKAIDVDPKMNDARYQYALILHDRGNTLEAFKHFERCVEQDPYNQEYLLMYSRVAFQMDKKSKSKRAVLKVLEQNGDNVDALSWLGFLYNDVNKTDSARVYLERAVSLDDECALCHEFLGDALLYEGSYAKAADSYEKSVGMRAYTETVSLKLAKSVLLSGLPEKASQLFEKILAMNNTNDEAFYWLVHAFLKLGWVDRARALFNRYSFSRKTGWIHLAQGEIYETQGNIDAALISFSVASRLLPDEPLSVAATGRMNLVKKEFDNAVVNFGKALGRDPHNPRYLLELGKAYEGLTDYRSAFQLYDEIIRKNPQFDEAFYLAARVLSKSGEHVKAVEMLEKGLQRNQESWKMHLALGHEYRITMQYEKAVTHYEEATNRGGADGVEGFRFIGYIYLEKLNDSKKAKKYFERYIKSGGKNPKVSSILSTLK